LKTVKRRELPDWFNQNQAFARRHTWRTTSGVKSNEVFATYQHFRNVNFPAGSQVTESESHPEWGRARRQASSPPGDVGGEFFSQRSAVYVDYPHRQRFFADVNRGGGIHDFYDWYGVVMATNPVTLPLPTLTGSDLNAMGATAIARCKPTNSVGSAANFLIELYREGLPRIFGVTLWAEKADIARAAGSEYLNEEFGWKPLVSDIRDICYGIAHAHAVLKQYERDSGKVVRRRYYFPVEETETYIPIGVGSPVMFMETTQLYDFNQPQSPVFKMRHTYRKVWFSGAFTYHLPYGYNNRTAMGVYAGKASALLGLDLTPEVLWNAAPWTWAIN
jgi:hypothetical protein